MEYALYRYEFEVIEKKDSSINLFPELSESFNPRQAFEKKSELLNYLLENDYQMLLAEQNQQVAEHNQQAAEPNQQVAERCPFPVNPASAKTELAFTFDSASVKPTLTFTSSRKKKLYHKYTSAPKDGFAILELARCRSISHRPKPFLDKAVIEDDYESLHIIIDNRGTYQRVAIEVKSSVFKKTDIVADSLARALSKAFARYGLLVKVVPIRDDKHFWSLVSDRKQFPRGFNKLCVKFPQINDPKVTEAMRRANIIYREMFHSNLVIIQESSEGEKLSFNEEDEKQREYMKLCAENADSIKVSPIGARPITLGGKTAKTQRMTDAERKNIEDVNHEIGLFDGDPIQSTQSFMDKAYGKA